MMPMARQPQKIVGSAKALLHYQAAEENAATLLLDQRGMIKGCDSASEKLFGYRRGELIWKHVSMLLPQLANVEFIQDGRINPRLLFLCRIGGYFQGLSRNGERFTSDLLMLNLFNRDSTDLRIIVRPC